MRKLLILNYYDIVGEQSSNQDKNLVSIQTLQAQLNIIQSSNIPIVRLKDWRRGSVSNGLNIALSFEGGFASHHEIVKPLLESLDIKACFFPDVNLVGTEDFMTWEQIKDLAEEQHFIGAKDCKQNNLNKMNPNELILYLENIRRTIRNKTDQRVNEFSIPSGKISNRIMEFVEISGFSNMLTNKAKINVDTEQFVLHRHRIFSKMGFSEFSKLIQEHSWVLFKTGLFAEVESWFSAVNPPLETEEQSTQNVEAVC